MPDVDASPAGLAMRGLCHCSLQSVDRDGKPHTERQSPVRHWLGRTAGLRREAEGSEKDEQTHRKKWYGKVDNNIAGLPRLIHPIPISLPSLAQSGC